MTRIFKGLFMRSRPLSLSLPALREHLAVPRVVVKEPGGKLARSAAH